MPYDVKNELGQLVSKYKPKYIRVAKEYLEGCKDTYGQFILEKDKKTGKKVTKFVTTGLKVRLPTIDGLRTVIGVDEDTIRNWEKKYPKFNRVVNEIRNEQKRRLIDMSLSGDYNPTIAKLLLSANHGMREGTDLTSGGETINTFNNEQINRIAERIATRRRGDGDSTSKK